ncbi:MAG TPA: hypothetical protein VM492_09980, partial [Sumerlaeia bacterium]|nr:hypothetical protein [Sumerlaeia bacterium]
MDNPSPKSRSTAAVLVLGLAVLLGALSWEIARNPQWGLSLTWCVTRLRSVLAAALAPAVALLLGFSALRPVRRRWGLPGSPSLSLSLALGWGLLSHLMLALGVAGPLMGRNLFSPWTPLLVVCLAGLALRKQAALLCAEVRTRVGGGLRRASTAAEGGCSTPAAAEGRGPTLTAAGGCSAAACAGA